MALAVKSLNRIFHFSYYRTVLIKERNYFILRFYLATIFLSLIKAQVSSLVKLVKLRQKTFFLKILVYIPCLKTQELSVKATYKMELFLTIVIASSCGLLPQ